MTEPRSTEKTKEILISRVVDGEATSRDWEDFRVLADRDPTLWRELAEYQHDHAELSAMVASAVAIADEVDAPAHIHMEQSMLQRLRIVGAWGGWAAAAAVGLTWAIAAPLSGPREFPEQRANLISTPAQFLQGYLERGKEEGRVIGELPDKLLVQTRRTEDGNGYEVIYIRQIYERAFVHDLFTFGVDEAGQPVPVRVQSVTPIEIGPM
jgi:hypothetical protein